MTQDRDKDMAGALPEIGFWFDFASNYSYLSAMRIEPAAERLGLRVAWRPFLLGPIFNSFGWDSSPFVLQKEKGAYVWRDMERQCRKYGLPWKKPSVFPRSAVLPMRVAAAHAGQPWIGAYCREMMRLNFALDRDIDPQDTVAGVLRELGLPAAELIDEAVRGAARTRLREQTAEAQRLGLFGAPSFLVRGELFWGNDRLDDALAFAAEPLRHSAAETGAE
ncbi:2-hydroxychromene-2-carboxylate isomerase [Caldimonas tepidiphila]|uniref:2-hydroxychromene-2-carboxylate isomerase n=1 Tax=Caldimonas tepidiphila TaxID=2315841 RepID=UPI001F0BCDEE|nr:2-hydroxychromene-2-carboxylate isomerase [Caldimonas tepidiphila]